MTTVSNMNLAALLRRCAQAMDDEDRRRIDAGESILHPVAGGPTGRGNDICVEIASAEGVCPFGELIYYLLAYTWNDALAWADRQE